MTNLIKKFIKYEIIFLAIILFFTISLTFNIARAESISGHINFSANVIASCNLEVIGSINFGSYDITNREASLASTSLNITCTNGADYNISLDYGNNVSEVKNNQRRLKHISLKSYLEYDIYQDKDMTIQWTNKDSELLVGTGNGSTQNIPIYAYIRAGQTNANVGAYSDIVNITVNYNDSST